MVQDGLRTAADQERIVGVLADPAQREVLLKRHADYLDFYAAWLGVPQPLPGWQRRIALRGQ